MQYGYFDEKAREYVITNPNTPAPWANYLGSPEYGAIVTQNAGGYSFVKSGAAGRADANMAAAAVSAIVLVFGMFSPCLVF